MNDRLVLNGQFSWRWASRSFVDSRDPREPLWLLLWSRRGRHRPIFDRGWVHLDFLVSQRRGLEERFL